MDADWDYFADSRRSQNRVSDSAASALYELGVAKGTGMGYFSPASTVSRGAMAAFITRALAHTSARPEGVTIQTDEPGGVIVSVRDANFHPVANAVVDVFSVRTGQGSMRPSTRTAAATRHASAARVANTSPCEIGAVDAVTGLKRRLRPRRDHGCAAAVAPRCLLGPESPVTRSRMAPKGLPASTSPRRLHRRPIPPRSRPIRGSSRVMEGVRPASFRHHRDRHDPVGRRHR